MRKEEQDLTAFISMVSFPKIDKLNGIGKLYLNRYGGLTMGKRFFLLIMFFQISLNCAMAAEVTPSFAFKYHMHRLFESYSNAWISVSLREYDVANIYLKYMIESVDEVRNFIPEKNSDGTKLDREQFTQRLNKLNNSVLELKIAISKGEQKKPILLSQEILNVCVGCHTEAKLKYLFKLPARRTLFAEYMHKISEHMDIARIYIEIGKSPEKVEENLRLIRYYLGLLDDTFPEKGPSGVILDKGDFNKRLKESKRISEEMLKDGKDKQVADIEAFKMSLNSFCVVCHEPERLK